jgi:catechol 2,3-dioxygenase
VLGLQISDRYLPTAWCRAAWCSCAYGTDHHGVALVGAAKPLPESSLNHFAFEVGTLAEVFHARRWLREHKIPLVFEGRRRAGCQVAVEFRDPDGNNLEIYWNIDQVGTTGEVRPPSEWRQARTLEDAVAEPGRRPAGAAAPRPLVQRGRRSPCAPSGAVGVVPGSKRAATAPERSTRNLAKFHLMSPGPSGLVGCPVSQA